MAKNITTAIIGPSIVHLTPGGGVGGATGGAGGAGGIGKGEVNDNYQNSVNEEFGKAVVRELVKGNHQNW